MIRMEKMVELREIYFHARFDLFCLLHLQISSVKFFHAAKIFLEVDYSELSQNAEEVIVCLEAECCLKIKCLQTSMLIFTYGY